MILANFRKDIIRDTYIENPLIEFAEYPPSMKSLEGPLESYIKVDYINSKTDSLGMYSIAFTIDYGKI